MVFQVVAVLLIAVATLTITHVLVLPGLPGLYYHLHTFLGGILAALAYRRVRGARILFGLNAVSMALAFFLIRDSYVLASLFFALLVGVAVSWSPLIRVLSTPILLRLGALSYCIYLFHMLVGGYTIHFLQVWVSGTRGSYQVGYVVIGIVTTIVVSALVHITIERPSIAASKWFSNAPISARRTLGLRDQESEMVVAVSGTPIDKNATDVSSL